MTASIPARSRPPGHEPLALGHDLHALPAQIQDQMLVNYSNEIADRMANDFARSKILRSTAARGSSGCNGSTAARNTGGSPQGLGLVSSSGTGQERIKCQSMFVSSPRLRSE